MLRAELIATLDQVHLQKIMMVRVGRLDGHLDEMAQDLLPSFHTLEKLPT